MLCSFLNVSIPELRVPCVLCHGSDWTENICQASAFYFNGRAGTLSIISLPWFSAQSSLRLQEIKTSFNIAIGVIWILDHALN